MKKCIIIPDSFKGTISSIKVCNMIAGEVCKHFPTCNIISIPVADGGEGTVDCLTHVMNGQKIAVEVQGPLGQPVKSFFGIVDDNIAIIEMAAASGLNLAYGKLDPMTTTTYGVGELIRHAVEKGCRKIILGLGGSCTNDGGAGMAAALGTKFFDADGKEFIPTGGTLKNVVRIDNRETCRLLDGVVVEAMCDIDNPMYGEKGAAYIFGPQKGADEKDVIELDLNLRHFAKVFEESFGRDVSHIPGSGAAGAMGAGVYSFLNGSLSSGIELVLEIVGFDDMLKNCDIVFTGEGRLDSQSLGGKVISGVGKHAKVQNVPVIAVCGCVEKGLDKELADAGIYKAWSVYDKPPKLEQILSTCSSDLQNSVAELLEELKWSS